MINKIDLKNIILVKIILYNYGRIYYQYFRKI